MKDNLPVVVLAVAVLIVGVLDLNQKAPEVTVISDGETRVVEPAGAFSGPDVYSYLKVYDWFEEGGGSIEIDTVDNAYTLTAADMDDVNYITFSASSTQPATTITLPATSTFPLGTDAGSKRTWIIENPFTAAATTTTIAAGTGVDLQEPDGQNVVIGINNYAVLTAIRQSSSDIVVVVDEVIPAD